jgi:hypothetical protein
MDALQLPQRAITAGVQSAITASICPPALRLLDDPLRLGAGPLTVRGGQNPFRSP